MEPTVYHIPALLNESIEGLAIKPDGNYVDATFGGGGHSRAILSRLGPKGRLVGMDQDMDARRNSLDDDRFTFAHGNFAYLKNFLRYYGINGVDGILADLGVSFHHFDDVERGFTFRADAPLDMRMNQRASLTARKVVNEYTEAQLADIFYLYGELKQSRRVAAAIVKARNSAPIETTGQLSELMNPILGFGREKKDLARMFQALRIEVNGEMKALRQMLHSATQLLAPGGRLVVLTYHSLEDRMVKNIIKSGNLEGRTSQDIYGRSLSPLQSVGKMQVPSTEEQEGNPRSRSAKLRIAEKI